MDFKIVKINQEFRNVVVSHKALLEAELEKQKSEIIGKLEKGQVLEGTVKNITNYGVFVDLGGVDGLIHITDLSWGRVNNPEEVVKLDEKIKVVVLDFNEQQKRIALGLKQLTAHPWDSLDPDIKVGDKVTGKVVLIADYGAFVEIKPGVESGDICAVVGLENFEIGDTICDFENPEPLPTIAIDEPPMSLKAMMRTRRCCNTVWVSRTANFFN